MFDRSTAVLLALGCASIALAQQVHEFPVATGPHAEYQPSICFETVVWTDDRDFPLTQLDLWGTNLRLPVQFPVCQGPLDQMLPHVRTTGGQTLCVWEDYRLLTAPDIFGRYLAIGDCFPITGFLLGERAPRTYGPYVAYERDSELVASTDIWYCLMPAGVHVPLCEAEGSQESPDVFGHNFVWADDRPDMLGNHWDIYVRDARTSVETNLTMSPWEDRRPRISGNWVVYESLQPFGTGWDIYAQRLGPPDTPPLPVCTQPGDQQKPAIWGNLIVWQDTREGLAKIYGYDLASGKEFRVSPIDINAADMEPDISQNVVVWSRYRTFTPDVYGALLDFSTITGHVDLQMYPPGPEGVPMELELQSIGGTEPALLPIVPDHNGDFTATTLLEGQFTVALKPSHWLRQRLDAVFTLAPGTTVNMNFQLLNGDAVQDNRVDLLDLNQVLISFGMNAPNPGDLDGSGVVDLRDLNIVLLNFGLEGDPG